MRVSILFLPAVFCLLTLSSFEVRADLNPKQARKLISRSAGFELANSAVRVKRISSINDTTAEATAEIETAFRLEQDDYGQWSVRDVRTGPNQWEQIEFFA